MLACCFHVAYPLLISNISRYFFFWISNEVLYQKNPKGTQLQSNRAPTHAQTAHCASKYTSRIQRNPNKYPFKQTQKKKKKKKKNPKGQNSQTTLTTPALMHFRDKTPNTTLTTPCPNALQGGRRNHHPTLRSPACADNSDFYAPLNP
jgi:hypothetical protein